MDFKELEFVRKESEGSQWNQTEWLGRYIYSYIYEILFFEFPIMLHECLSKLETQQRNFQGGEPREWNPYLINRLKRANNLVSRAVDFWVHSILEEYINEFVVDTITLYSEAE